MQYSKKWISEVLLQKAVNVNICNVNYTCVAEVTKNYADFEPTFWIKIEIHS